MSYQEYVVQKSIRFDSNSYRVLSELFITRFSKPEDSLAAKEIHSRVMNHLSLSSCYNVLNRIVVSKFVKKIKVTDGNKRFFTYSITKQGIKTLLKAIS